MPDRGAPLDSHRFGQGRHAGALVPLFSIPSRASWGVGEIGDLPRFARWLDAAGLDIVQILPVNEMSDGQNSPYSAMSAMAIDPVYIAVGEVEEFVAEGGEASLSAAEQADLAIARSAPAVDYHRVRALKSRALRDAFARFEAGSPRANTFRAFTERERWWLDEYTLFRALHTEHESRYWLEWEPGLRSRQAPALEEARRRLGTAMRYYAWLQWIADEQWQRARHACGRVGIFGDFPFMVSGDSADVWARQHEFRLDASVGVPPDAFSKTGQDWGLPAYRWDVMAEGDYEWLRHRARRCRDLYDGFRVDHLVGFYRTYIRERDRTAHFVPPDEPDQLAQGERVLALLADSGSHIIAEDLGVVPDFVRESLVRLGVPGLKVLRWERDWHDDDKPFLDPATYPETSVAISGTHDTESVAEWWDSADDEERTAVVELPSLAAAGCRAGDGYSDTVRDALIEALFAAGSGTLLLPVQDVFGWRDRVNTPAVVDDVNWTWRLPWPVDDLMTETSAVERAGFLRALAGRYGRG